jgi:hypothetical protein
MASKQINPNGLAILEVLKSNTDRYLSFAEIASLAGIEPKTGYLTAAKKAAKDAGKTIVKLDDFIEIESVTVDTFPSGLQVERKTTKTVAGYLLKDAE